MNGVLYGKDHDEAFQEKVYNSNGLLNYRIHTPENMNPEKKYPLIIFFYGAGSRGRALRSKALRVGKSAGPTQKRAK